MISKKKKKKKVFAKIQSDFSPKFRKFKRLSGGLFSYGGGYFPFFTENRPQKHKIHAFLHTSQANGGGSSPPAPPLATLLAKAKDSLSKDRPSRGQGQECSRPRPRTKDTAANVFQKKRSSKKFFRQSPIYRRSQNF